MKSDYPPRNYCGPELDFQPDSTPADHISHVNWPHSSREHDRAVRWFLATPEQKKVMREAEMVMAIYRDALRG